MSKTELQGALDALNKTYGAGTIRKINEAPDVDIVHIPSGSLILDLVLGGGYPQGKIIEIFGDESTGKSTLALHFLANFKNQNVVYVDTEHSLDRAYAERLGCNLDNMIISQPDNFEQALDITIKTCPHVDAMVFDSVAESSPKKEIEGDISDQDIGLKAKLMSRALRILKSTKHKATIVFINQIRENPAAFFGSPRVTPAGRGLKFATHVRLDIYGRGAIKHSENEIGHYMRIKIAKNKLGIPHLKCAVPIIYDGYGVSREQEVLDLALDMGIMKKAASWIKYGDVNIAQGMERSRTFLLDNPDLVEELIEKIKNESN